MGVAGGGGVACIGGLERGPPFPLSYYISMVDWLKMYVDVSMKMRLGIVT